MKNDEQNSEIPDFLFLEVFGKDDLNDHYKSLKGLLDFLPSLFNVEKNEKMKKSERELR